jgi:hypothetical protein
VQGSRDSDPAKVEFIGPHVFLWAGLDQGSLRNHFGDVMDQKFEGKQAILRIYGFYGEASEEGGGGGVDTQLRIKLPPGSEPPSGKLRSSVLANSASAMTRTRRCLARRFGWSDHR